MPRRLLSFRCLSGRSRLHLEYFRPFGGVEGSDPLVGASEHSLGNPEGGEHEVMVNSVCHKLPSIG